MHDDTIRNQFRRSLDEVGSSAGGARDDLAQHRSLPAGLTVTRHWFAGVPSEWINPPEPRSRVILYLHGGGFTTGSCATYRGFVGRLALACRARAVVPEYRLAPEHPFPAGLDDTIEVYATLLGHGIEAEQLVLIGDEAGAGLCLSTLLEAQRRRLALPRALVLLSPWTDLTRNDASKVDPRRRAELLEPVRAQYLAGTDPADPRVSPLLADLAGLPPTLIHVGDQELLRDDSNQLAQRARAAGVEVELELGSGEGLLHMSAVDPIGRFVNGQFSRTPSDGPVVQRAREVTRRQAFCAVSEKFSTST